MVRLSDTKKEKDFVFEEACRLRDQGEYSAALWLLSDNKRLFHGSVPFRLVRSYLYFKMQMYDNAIADAKRGISEQPDHRLLTKILFHSLWDKGDTKSRLLALQEIARFNEYLEMDDYRDLVAEYHSKRVELFGLRSRISEMLCQLFEQFAPWPTGED